MGLSNLEGCADSPVDQCAHQSVSHRAEAPVQSAASYPYRKGGHCRHVGTGGAFFGMAAVQAIHEQQSAFVSLFA